MEAGRRFVEQVQYPFARGLSQVGRQLDTLGLSTRQGIGGLAESEVPEADVREHGEFSGQRGHVREELERYEGRLRYLKTRVATSTLTITVHERLPLLSATPGENVIVDAFKDAWRNFVRLVAAFIASLGVLIPLAAIGVAAWLVRKRFMRAR